MIVAKKPEMISSGGSTVEPVPQNPSGRPGPVAGRCLDLQSNEIPMLDDFPGVDWVDSDFERDANLRKRGIMFSYGQSRDKRWWRRETTTLGTGYRQIRETPEQQLNFIQQMTLPRLLSRLESGFEFEFLPFWAGSGLSLQSAHCFNLDGNLWPTVQHFLSGMLARTVGDNERFDRMLGSDDPANASRLAHEIIANAKANKLTPWKDMRYNLAVRGTFHKCAQNKDALHELLRTGDAVLVASTKYNLVWGAGVAPDAVDVGKPQNWPGENLLGFAMMESRKRLRKEVENGNLN